MKINHYTQHTDQGPVRHYQSHISIQMATYINKKNYNMIYHIIIGGFIDVYIVVRVVWF